MELPMEDGPDKEMWLALIFQNLDRLSKALASGANPNCLDERGMAPAMLAAMLYNLEAVKLLGAYGARYPQDVPGWCFEVYFAIPEPWFSHDAVWSAERVAVHRRDEQLLDALIALPGALDVLARHGSVLDREAAPCYAHKLLTQQHEPALILPILRHAAAQTLSADHPLSDEESRLVNYALQRFMAPLLRTSNDPYWIAVRSTAEHVRDSGYAVPGQEHMIRALAFGIEGSGAHPPISANASEEATGIISDGYDCGRIDVGIVQLSPFAWVRMAACTYENPDASYDRKDRQRRTMAPYIVDDEDYYTVAGTIFFSTERHALERHMRLLGPARLALDLTVAVHSDSYELTKSAIAAGADTTMTCVGELSADVLAASHGYLNALRALLDHDPITRARLSREKFDLDSPLRMAIRAAGWSAKNIDKTFAIFPLERRAQAEGYPSSSFRRAESAMLLITAGANVNSRDIVSTPLEAASLLKLSKTVEALLEAGADPSNIIEGRSVVSGHLDETIESLLRSWHGNR